MLRISKLTYGAVKEILAVIVSTRKEVLFFDAMLDKSIKNKTDAKVIAVINPDSFIQAKLPNKKKKNCDQSKCFFRSFSLFMQTFSLIAQRINQGTKAYKIIFVVEYIDVLTRVIELRSNDTTKRTSFELIKFLNKNNQPYPPAINAMKIASWME